MLTTPSQQLANNNLHKQTNTVSFATFSCARVAESIGRPPLITANAAMCCRRRRSLYVFRPTLNVFRPTLNVFRPTRTPSQINKSNLLATVFVNSPATKSAALQIRATSSIVENSQPSLTPTVSYSACQCLLLHLYADLCLSRFLTPSTTRSLPVKVSYSVNDPISNQRRVPQEPPAPQGQREGCDEHGGADRARRPGSKVSGPPARRRCCWSRLRVRSPKLAPPSSAPPSWY